MIVSEILLFGLTYFTLWLYRFFKKKQYLFYFLLGTITWTVYLVIRTAFQFFYLKDEPGFKGNTVSDILINNITIVTVYFLFVTACKYFKDGYISQQFESEKNKQQLIAEVNNLKSQIAPHFLFNTLNNLYGLAVDKSDKLPDLMLRLSDLLRHSLYETQKPLVAINDEIITIKSYIKLETLRLEHDVKVAFENDVPANSVHQIAPLLLIVFIENAFKHSKLVRGTAMNINISLSMVNDRFTLLTRNNYNTDRDVSGIGIGLKNVKRRLDVLYPNNLHELLIKKDDQFFTVILTLQLTKAI